MSADPEQIVQAIPNAGQRLDLWAQMQAIAHWILEVGDAWWEEDPQMQECHRRRLGVDEEVPDEISDS